MKYKLKSTNDVIKVNLFFLFKSLFFPHNPQFPSIFFSTNYGIAFNSFSEYWLELGKRNGLIEVLVKKKQRGVHGFSFEEVLQKASTSEFGSGIGVILFNINLLGLGRTLDRFPGIDTSTFKEDFVFIPVNSREEAGRIISRITPLLAEAVAIDKGLIFLKNETEIKD